MLHRFNHILREEYRHISPVFVPSIALFLFFLGWGVIGPFFTINAKQILVTPFLVGVFTSLWGVIRFVTDFFVGSFVDISDAKKLVTISFFGYVLVGFGYYFIDTPLLLLAWRVVHSLFGSVLWVGLWGYLHKTIPSQYRDEDLTFQSIARTIPSIFAPFLGAIIFTLSNPKNVFLVMALFSTFAGIIFLFRAKPARSVRAVTVNTIIQRNVSMIRSFRTRFAFVGLMLLGVFLISGAYGTFIPIFLFDAGFSSIIIALVAVVQSIPIFFALPVSRYADKIGRKPVLWWGIILLITALLALSASSSLAGILGSVLLLGFAFAIITPTANALVGDMAVDGEQGVIAGMGEMFKDLGALSGPFLGGLIISQFNFSALLMILAVVAGLLLVITFRFHEQKIPLNLSLGLAKK
ncbi:hypothetical protein COT72_05205 [archaeon CG10_big_fil_rev_8_21_14_0_10_43_11]|nr:MAG: hypothetical protein COT72_05205 [archaeon CG10_big_fil_rev_8_21_14_0_10_43_11]